MNTVLEYIRDQRPDLAGVPDRDLTLYLGEERPDLVKAFPDFRKDYWKQATTEAWDKELKRRPGALEEAAKTAFRTEPGAFVAPEGSLTPAERGERAAALAEKYGKEAQTWDDLAYQAAMTYAYSPSGMIGAGANALSQVACALVEDVLQGQTPIMGDAPVFVPGSALPQVNWFRRTGMAVAAPVTGEGPPPEPLPGERQLTLVEQGVVDVAHMAGPMAGAGMMMAFGMPPLLAWGNAMGLATLEETGDWTMAARDAAIGAAMPQLSLVAREGVANALVAAAKRGLFSCERPAVQKAMELLADQGALQALTHAMNWEVYLAEPDPKKRQEMIVRTAAGMGAFLPLSAWHAIGRPSATQRAWAKELYGALPEGKVGFGSWLMSAQADRAVKAVAGPQTKGAERLAEKVDPRQIVGNASWLVDAMVKEPMVLEEWQRRLDELVETHAREKTRTAAPSEERPPAEFFGVSEGFWARLAAAATEEKAPSDAQGMAMFKAQRRPAAGATEGKAPSDVQGGAEEALGPRHWQAATPDGKVTVKGTYEVVDQRDLAGKVAEGQAAGLQPRDRRREASKEQVAQMAMNWQPSRAGEAPTTDVGAPMVTEDGLLLAGYGRTAALGLVYETGDRAGYKDWLARNAGRFGLDPQEVAGVERPVLVRRVADYGGVSRQELARLSNQHQVLGLSEAEAARADAAALAARPDLLGKFRPGAGGEVVTAGNREFLNDFVNLTGASAELRTKEGWNAGALDKRVRNALLGLALGPESRHVISNLIESPEEFGLKRIGQGIVQQAAALAKLRGTQYDLGGVLEQALRDLVGLKQSNLKLEEFLGQAELLGNPGRTAESDGLLRWLAKQKSIASVADFLGRFARSAEENLKIGQSAAGQGLLGEKPLTRAEALEALYELERRQGAGQETITFGKPAGRGRGASETGAGEPPRPAEAGDEGGGGGGAGRGGAGAAGGGTAGAGVEAPKSEFGAKNKLVTNEDLAKSLERLRKLTGKTFAGAPDPAEAAEIMAELVKVGVYYAEGGVRQFKEWSERMVAALGEWARPYLADVYQRATEWRGLDAEVMKQELESGKVRYESTEVEPGGAGTDVGGRGGADGGSGPIRGGGDRGAVTPSRIIDARPRHTRHVASEGVIAPEIGRHLTRAQAEGAALAILAMEDRLGAEGGTGRAFGNQDGMGTGKTRQILTIGDHFARQGRPVVIVTKGEALRPLDWQARTLGGSYLEDARAMGIGLTVSPTGEGQPGKIAVTTYERLGGVLDYVRRHPREAVLLFDEAHALKNAAGGKSLRGRRGMAALELARSVGFFSATPVDKPEHLMYMARLGLLEGQSESQALKRLGLIQRTYRTTGGKYATTWVVNPQVGRAGALQRVEEVMERLTARGRIIRRELDFRGVDITNVRVALPEEVKTRLRDIYSFLAEPATKAGREPDGLLLAQIRMAQRRQQEPAKVPVVTRLALEELAKGRQVVVFISRVNPSAVQRKVRNRFGEVVDVEELCSSEGTVRTLRAALEEAGVKPEDIAELHGGAGKQAESAAADFQARQKKVLLATVESGGTGINLDDRAGDAPRTMIMMTAPFGAAENVQACGRLWRLLTRSKPRIIYVNGDTTIDDWNARIIGSKMKMLNAVVGGDVGRLDIAHPDTEQVMVSRADFEGQEIRRAALGRAVEQSGAGKEAAEPGGAPVAFVKPGAPQGKAAVLAADKTELFRQANQLSDAVVKRMETLPRRENGGLDFGKLTDGEKMDLRRLEEERLDAVGEYLRLGQERGRSEPLDPEFLRKWKELEAIWRSEADAIAEEPSAMPGAGGVAPEATWQANLLPRHISGIGPGPDISGRKPVSLAGVRRFVVGALDIPVRLGVRVPGGLRGALELYLPKAEEIRMRAINLIDVLGHGIGHHLHYILFPGKGGHRGLPPEASDFGGAYDAELLGLGKETSLPRYTRHQVRKEGVANYVRDWLADPAAALAKAPKFGRFFEETLKRDYSEVWEALSRAQGMLQEWIESPALAKAKSAIGWEVEKVKRTAREVIGYYYQKLQDDTAPIQRAARELERLGLPSAAARHIGDLVTNYVGGCKARAEHTLLYGQLDHRGRVVGPGLCEVLGPLAADQDFWTYCVMKRAMELHRRSAARVARGETPIMLGEDMAEPIARAVVAQLEGQYEVGRKRVLAFLRNELKMLEEAEFITKPEFARIEAANEAFMPFVRVREFVAGAPGGRGGFVDTWKPLHRVTGGTEQIVPPLESIIRRVYQWRDAAERNRIRLELVKGIERVRGGGRLADEVLAKVKPIDVTAEEVTRYLRELGLLDANTELGQAVANQIGTQDLGFRIWRQRRTDSDREGIFPVWHGGRQVWYQTSDPLLYASLKMLDKWGMQAASNIAKDVLRWQARTLRVGAVATPEFGLRNIARDTMSAAVYSPYGFRPFYDTARGMFHALGRTDLYRRWLQAGGKYSEFLGGDRDVVQRAIKDWLGPNDARKALRWLNPKRVFETWQMLTDMGSRIAEFDRALKAGETPLRAANASKDITLNYARAGEWVRWGNQFVPFLVAGFADMDKFCRAHDFRNPRRAAGAMLRAAAYITVPSVLCWHAGKDDEEIQRLPQWRRTLFWNWNLGRALRRAGWSEAPDWILPVPKPFLLGQAYGTSVESVLNFVYEKDPNAVEKWLRALWGQTPLTPSALTPPGLKAGIEAWANKSMFRNRAIESPALQDLPRSERYTAGTSESAKLLGQWSERLLGSDLALSPAIVDNTVRDLFGGLGRYGTDALDWALVKARLVDMPAKPDFGLADVPGARALVTPPWQESEWVARFYRGSKLADQLMASAEKRPKKLDGDQQWWWARNEVDVAWYLPDRHGQGRLTDLHRARKELSLRTRAEQYVLAHTSMTPQEKAAALAELGQQKDTIARAAVMTMLSPNHRRRAF